MKAYKHKKKVNCIRKKQDKKIVTADCKIKLNTFEK